MKRKYLLSLIAILCLAFVAASCAALRSAQRHLQYFALANTITPWFILELPQKDVDALSNELGIQLEDDVPLHRWLLDNAKHLVVHKDAITPAPTVVKILRVKIPYIQAFRPAKLTTVKCRSNIEKDSIKDTLVFDKTSNKIHVYTGSAELEDYNLHVVLVQEKVTGSPDMRSGYTAIWQLEPKAYPSPRVL